MVLERLLEMHGPEDETDRRELLISSDRVRLHVLLDSCGELLSQGALCPKLLWQEYRKAQRLPNLEVVYGLHCSNLLTHKYIFESDEDAGMWLVSRMQALCEWTPPQGDEESRQVQYRVLSTLFGVLVDTGFEESHDSAGPGRRVSLLCRSVLDKMLFWLLDIVDRNVNVHTVGTAADLWIRLFDPSLCGVCVSARGLQCFFTLSLTQALTYKPQFTVSDAISLQSQWTFARSSGVLTFLFRKLAVIFSVEQLLCHLQQVLETHEVNWKHVLCFLSTLLVYNPCAQTSLRELLAKMLRSAFEGYDLERIITAFLLARQGALEGPNIFYSYSNWFKMCFGGSSGNHVTSKKSLVFLLKFLSDLVPFEPAQYLKVHILHPPYVPVKHRGLLMDYISLVKTRLVDLKESVEDMGLFEDVCGATTAPEQAVQDVEKAVSLFEGTGRISATVMEASIFRRPYFLTQFLPALLTPRVLPVKADARMTFIEVLKNADKIPAAQFSSYVESCQRQRHSKAVHVDSPDAPVEVLEVQLQQFRELVSAGSDGEMSAQLSRVSHTLSIVFPGVPERLLEPSVVRLHTDTATLPQLHGAVVNLMLRNFCQCALDSTRANPPNKQSLWASGFVAVIRGSSQLLSSLLHRLFHLFRQQEALLSSAHLLGLAVLVAHLHVSLSHSHVVEVLPPALPRPVPVGEALSLALVCSTRAHMHICVRLCLAVVSYGLCRGDSLPRRDDYIISSFYKKLLYLIPRLLPEARRTPAPAAESTELSDLWTTTSEPNTTWRKAALHLWRHSAFCQLGQTPQYQLFFTDWLTSELSVQRSEDALSDAERLEYQQWACLELYLHLPVERGGCGGDMKNLCSQLVSAIMDKQLSDGRLGGGVSSTGSCLPDILSKLQEVICEMTVSSPNARRDVCEVLFKLLSQRCLVTSAAVSADLSVQRTLHVWNRVLLALPAVSLVKVTSERVTTTLDCHGMMEHVNQQQRNACSPAGLLSRHVTTHLVKGLLCASAQCTNSCREFDQAWCEISVHCPLLLVSTAHWWKCVSPALLSLWHRLTGGGAVPDQLQLLACCQRWACSMDDDLDAPMPLAPPLLLAACLHRACQRRKVEQQKIGTSLEMMKLERTGQRQQVLVFMLFLCVNTHLSSLLDPQDQDQQRSRTMCTYLLTVLVDSPDWLVIFQLKEHAKLPSLSMMTSDASCRLLPFVFYRLMLQQSAELQHRAVACPGFVHTAVLCYIELLQLFLDGQMPQTQTDAAANEMEVLQIQSRSKEFVLRTIAEAPPTALRCSQLTQLESLCAHLDPEVAAALSQHVGPEMDFL
ncbi:Fanconi anemia group A protein [Thalassophryne amazonica]|uniref:Fanconi anemia group A protein n=1 Tax=Thalassophryne amazonica TaxID=390379 RepID=UPI001471BC2B|nr:Fanconi anemia group A protein [Thalassophryne amazonica]